MTEFFPIQAPFSCGAEKGCHRKEGTGYGPPFVYTAFLPDQKGTGLSELKGKSLNPWAVFHGVGPDLIVRSKKMGGHLPGEERGRCHIDDADAHMEPFVPAAEPIAPLRTRKLRIQVEKSSPVVEVALKPQASPFTEALAFETMA